MLSVAWLVQFAVICMASTSYRRGSKQWHFPLKEWLFHGQVRETLDFSARCQGVGHKSEELRMLMEREAEQGIDPDPEMDAFMKVGAMLACRERSADAALEERLHAVCKHSNPLKRV